MEQFKTEQGSYTGMEDDEMMLRQKYLRQPEETKEQREQRIANVRKMLAEAREQAIGVKKSNILESFRKGRGV